MANIKISDLTAYTDAASTDILPIVDIGNDVTKKITIGNVVKAVPLGTAALPGLAFDGDPNSGVYSPGADQVAISTNGTGRLFVDASGNVGVGTASPTTRLEVARQGASWTGTAPIAGTALFVHNGSASASSAARLSILSGNAIDAAIYFGDTDNNSEAIIKLDNADDSLQFNVNGSERLRITSTGALNFVGAGTAGVTQAVSFNGSAPVNSLVIDSSGRLGLGTSSVDSLFHLQKSDATAYDAAAVDGQVGVGPTIYLENPAASNATVGGQIVFGMRSTEEQARIGATGGTTPVLTFGTGDVERMRITAAGIGIGTVSPASSLHIAGSTPQVRVQDTDGTNQTGIFYKNGAATTFYSQDGTSNGSYQWIQNNGTTSTASMVLDSSGRLGIGTTSPQQKLSVSNNGAEGFELAPAGGGANINVYYDYNRSGAAYCTHQAQALDFRFRTGVSPTEKVAIDSSGRLLVGTASSFGNYLSQIGYEGSSTSNGLYIKSTSTSADTSTMVSLERSYTVNNTDAVILFADTTAVRFTVRNNGGIANFSANNVNLSDRNVKKDIVPAADTWDCLKEWEIVNFRYKDQPDDTDLNMGVIAQQVAESCPEVITVFEEATEDKPEKLGVKDQQMMWMAIKALQEAQLRIETLETEVAALKGA